MTTAHARGFGLVEALVTVMIISIGYLALARLHTALWRSASAMENMLSAYSVATRMNEQDAIRGEILTPPVLRSSTTEFHPEVITGTDGSRLFHVYTVHWKEGRNSRSISLEPVRLLDRISDLAYLPVADNPAGITATGPPQD